MVLFFFFFLDEEEILVQTESVVGGGGRIWRELARLLSAEQDIVICHLAWLTGCRIEDTGRDQHAHGVVDPEYR